MAVRLLNADTGTDSGTGLVTPWQTLGYANTHMTDGDTLYLQNATANYAISYASFLYQTANITNITVQGQSALGCKLAPVAGNRFILAAAAGLSTVLTINNCSITHNQYSNYGFIEPFTGFTLNMNNCILNGDTTVGNCIWFSGNYGGGQNPIITVRNSLFLNHYGSYNAIVASHTATGTVTVNFYNNTFYHCYNFTFNNGGAAPYVITCKNNIFHTFGSTFDAKGNWVANGCVSQYNDFYNMTGGLTGISTGTGCITSDPLFVDLANGNYNLRPTSPCVDSGVII